MLTFRQASKAECVVLLENVRFHKGETKNDPAFAEKVSLAEKNWIAPSCVLHLCPANGVSATDLFWHMFQVFRRIRASIHVTN